VVQGRVSEPMTPGLQEMEARERKLLELCKHCSEIVVPEPRGDLRLTLLQDYQRFLELLILVVRLKGFQYVVDGSILQNEATLSLGRRTEIKEYARRIYDTQDHCCPLED
jgi:hypothetical protein